MAKWHMIGEYHWFFSLPHLDLLLDMLLLLTHLRDEFIDRAYYFRLLMLHLVSRHTYRGTAWLGLGTILEMLAPHVFIIGTSALLGWCKWGTAHVNFLVAIWRHVSFCTAHRYYWNLVKPHVGHRILSLERSLSVFLLPWLRLSLPRRCLKVLHWSLMKLVIFIIWSVPKRL